MRNLIILQDLIQEFPCDLTPEIILHEKMNIVDVCAVTERDELLVLFNSGILLTHNISREKDNNIQHEPWDLCSLTESPDDKWFYVQVIGETNSIICISHTGTICSIKSNRITDIWNDVPEIEGCVDDGIADASASPDQTCIVIVTNNNTILLMTNSFDPINEVPIENRVPGSPCSLSWRGDSQQFALYTVDNVDNIPRVRIYNRELILINESRTAAEGAGAIVRNLLPCIAYAPNGSMIAVGQQKTPKKQQVINS